MSGLRIAVDLRGLDPDRPAGPARYARQLLEALRAAAGEHAVELREPGGGRRPADVVVALGGSPRLTREEPVVAAVYDVSHLVAPATLSLAERARRSFRAAWLTRQAAHLLAPSRGVAIALARYLRVPDDRLSWLPNVGPGWTRAARSEVEAERAALGLQSPYLLFAGAFTKRKDLPLLLAAWTALPAGVRPELVLCGTGVPPPLPDGVRALGYVSDGRLLRLLSGATALVLPSRAEGCAMPALEAMATGTPPIVSAGTAPAEVVGTAGIVVPAGDTAAWAAAMRLVCEDLPLRNRMAARGIQAVRDLNPMDAATRCLAAAEAAARSRAR